MGPQPNLLKVCLSNYYACYLAIWSIFDILPVGLSLLCVLHLKHQKLSGVWTKQTSLFVAYLKIEQGYPDKKLCLILETFCCVTQPFFELNETMLTLCVRVIFCPH